MYFQYINIWLITLDSRLEIQWYLGKKRRGMKMLDVFLGFSAFVLMVITYMYME